MESSNSQQWKTYQVQYDWGSELTLATISANQLCVYQAQNNNQILLIDLLRPHLIQQVKWNIETPNAGSAADGKSPPISAMFLEPSAGSSALFAHATTGEIYWMAVSSSSFPSAYDNSVTRPSQVKPPQKLRFKCRSRVTSVAWASPEGAAKTLLIGTANGGIYQSSPLPDFSGSLKSASFKQVYAVDIGEQITGMFAFNTSGQPAGTGLLLSTRSRLFCFQFPAGRVDFSLYLDRRPVLQEFPVADHSSNSFASELRVVLDKYGQPKSFGWTTAVGVYHGDFLLQPTAADSVLIENTHILPYPHYSDKSITQLPSSIAMTQFHFIMLYADRVCAVCRINDEMVWDEPLEKLENARLLVDNASGTFWIRSPADIYEIVVSQEEKYVWRLYLKKNQFELALDLVQTEEEKDEILRKQADYYLKQGKQLMAAGTYANTNAPFEEIALKFLQLGLPSAFGGNATTLSVTTASIGNQLLIADIAAGDTAWAALITYLQKIWKRFSLDTHRLQRTLIATWMLELYLKRLALATTGGDKSSGPDSSKQSQQRQSAPIDEISAEYREWISDAGVCEALDRRTAYQLFESYGRPVEMILYSTIIKDYERVIDYDFQQGKFLAALEDHNMDLIYKYSPFLIEYLPEETVNLWIRNPKLNPKNLLPSLINYDFPAATQGTDNQAIRYLEYCVNRLGNTDMAIHNYLLALYARSDNANSNERLLAFLKSSTFYDVTYALRLCTQHNRVHPSVIVYGSLGLYDEAVLLALEHDDIELAQIYADKPIDDRPRRKKLWLDIAKYVIHKHNDIRLAMEYIERCGDLIQIEDILPFFPDFVVIGEFKEEICAALEKYKLMTEDLRRQMDEATRCAESIRLDIRALKSRFLSVPANSKCSGCGLPLFIREFMAFPCRHCFHADCLLSTLMKDMFSSTQQRRVIYLQEMIAREEEQQRNYSPGSLPSPTSPSATVEAKTAKAITKTTSTALEKYRNEFDEMVGADCALCGNYLIQSIDRSFIDERRDAELISRWSLV